jgi:hypothetical protein
MQRGLRFLEHLYMYGSMFFILILLLQPSQNLRGQDRDKVLLSTFYCVLLE